MSRNIQKFEKLDLNAIFKRNMFFQENNLSAKFAIDNWGLLAGHVPISQLLAKYEIIKQVLNIPGHILEFGVFNGANLLLMAKIMKVFAPNDLKKIYGFDSFYGLTEFSKSEAGVQENIQGMYKGDKELLEKMILLHELEDTVIIVDGLIENTLKKFLEDNLHYLFSLIYIDTDLYSSTKVILENIWERVAPGGIIAFDEGYHDRFPGEGIAAQEFFKKIEGRFDIKSFPYARQPMFYLVKR